MYRQNENENSFATNNLIIHVKHNLFARRVDQNLLRLILDVDDRDEQILGVSWSPNLQYFFIHDLIGVQIFC